MVKFQCLRKCPGKKSVPKVPKTCRDQYQYAPGATALWHLKQHTQIQSVLAHTLKVAILTSYKKLSVVYFELKLHIHTLRISETYFTSCKKEHNRSPLMLINQQNSALTKINMFNLYSEH